MTDIWKELILYIPYENFQLVELYLLENGYNSYELIDPRTELEDKDLETWLYFDKDIFKDEYKGITIKLYSQEDNFNNLIDYINEYKLGTYEKNEIDDSDWENNWKNFHHTMEIGEKIVIKPQWEDYDNKDNKIVMELSPGMAFGTGNHESTELALINIEKYIKKADKVLDIGTGSGILAIAAKLLGAGPTTGTDIDEKSILIAKENSENNNVDIEFLQSNLLDQVQGKYDLVIANIVAEIIEEMLEDLDRVLNKDGYFIVSGILDSRLDKLLKGLEENNLQLVDQIKKNEWLSLVVRFKDV